MEIRYVCSRFSQQPIFLKHSRSFPSLQGVDGALRVKGKDKWDFNKSDLPLPILRRTHCLVPSPSSFSSHNEEGRYEIDLLLPIPCCSSCSNMGYSV
ncbi:unnamed protein product [Linum trigynum]|uniref:Uncharacterized protein n=1 Tax=Linum trigynum TaxID=586398 RepID=A0AAV2DDJ4_9ROSI